jgi:uncharacterized membrane protein
MEAIKLIGVVIVIVGLFFKCDAMATVVVAGLVTGAVAGMTPETILHILGKSFIDNRLATLFILTLPVVGLCERNGLKNKAVDFIRSLKNASTGHVLSTYLVIKIISTACSIRVSGHPQFVRPLIYPMTLGAAEAKFDKEITEEVDDELKAMSAANENIGNFFAQNCFMGSSGTLLVASTMTDLGYNVTALEIAIYSIPIAIMAMLFGIIYNSFFDSRLEKLLRSTKGNGGLNGVDLE